MDFSIPTKLANELEQFRYFLKERMTPHLNDWYRERGLPRKFFIAMAENGWFGFHIDEGQIKRRSILRDALLLEELAVLSPGTAIATLVHIDLGLLGLSLFGSSGLIQAYGPAAVKGEILLCLGNTEHIAGSDAAGIAMKAEKTNGGWRLNGTKAYVTNGLISDMAIITAVTDPDADRKQRISMFIVDLANDGVSRTRLNKQVWIPSDLTRLKFDDVFVPDDHMLGRQGQGLQQLLTIFTHSRVGISALTLGTTRGALELAVDHAQRRSIFNQKLVTYQAKAFELADLYARMEAARLMLHKTCWKAGSGQDFKFEASMAKYLSVAISREVTAWAADMLGASSVLFESPIHKYPMDAWASSLGEGTQDIQKLIIFRNLMLKYQQPS